MACQNDLNLASGRCSDQACQTDESFLHTVVRETNSPLPNATSESKAGGGNESKPLDSKSIADMLFQGLASSGMVFDAQTGRYFDWQNGLYYEQDKQLYIDLKEQIYYRYIFDEVTQAYQLRYHSHFKPTSPVTKREDMYSLASSYPPCIRAVLVESSPPIEEEIETDLVGSLFIIPFTGGTIGSGCKTNLVNFATDSGLSEVLSKVEYDVDLKGYFIAGWSLGLVKMRIDQQVLIISVFKDEKGSRGTMINGKPIVSGERHPLVHGDLVSFGSSRTLLIHIHEGDNTCVNCEPGVVMSKIQPKEPLYPLKSTSRKDFQKEMNAIKKKYQINEPRKHEDETVARDRAKERREQVGIDYSHIETKPADAATPIPQDNIGMKMLKKAGWSAGQGLGKKAQGIVEPITAQITFQRRGIGSENASSSISNLDTEKAKKSFINWNKTVERYQKVSKEIKPVFDEDDDDVNDDTVDK